MKFLTIYVFRPLLKLVDRLLLVGMLRDEDVEKLLIMINPETWDSNFQKGWMNSFMRILQRIPIEKFTMVLVN